MNRLLAIALLAPISIGMGTGKAWCQKVGKTIAYLLPQQDTAYGQGVSGHMSHYLQRQLIVAGGCNFPDIPVVNGGQKRFYDAIYAGKLTTNRHRIAWSLIGHLPTPTAYAASIQWRDKIVVAGGKSPSGDLRSVYIIELNSISSQITITSLPNLPQSRSGMAYALLGCRLYLIGGEVDGKLSTSICSIDLSDAILNPQSSTWQDEGNYPGDALLKILATGYADSLGEHIYLFGAYAGIGKGKVSTQLSGWKFSLQTHQWTRVALPKTSLLKGTSWGGGLIRSYKGQIELAGGVDATRFCPALQRGEDIHSTIDSGDSIRLSELKTEVQTYLSHPISWYNFSPYLFSYNPSKRRWKRSSALPLVYSRADATWCPTPWGWCIIGGEVKPGIRTPSIQFLP